MDPAAAAPPLPAADLPDLPDECWELVFEHLGDSRPCWQSLSLTCKRFLHISNATRRSLAVTSLCASLPGGLPRILARFQGLRHIDLSRYHMPSGVGGGGGGNTGTTTGSTTSATTTTTVCLARPLEAVAHAELPRLRALNLQGQRGPLPWDALAALGTRLRELNISRFQGLRNHDLTLVARALPGLEKLDISYPQQQQSQQHGGTGTTSNTNMVSDRGVQVMAAGLKRLRSLNLSGHHLLTDAAMEALAARCRELEELTVFDCVNVTDRGLQVLAVHCLNLTTLAVNGRRVTAAGIEGVISSTSKRLLCLKLCHMNLTDEALEQLTDPAAATGGAAGAWYAGAGAAGAAGYYNSGGAGGCFGSSYAGAGPGSSSTSTSSSAAAASTTTFSSSYSSSTSSVMSVSVDVSDTESLPDSSSSIDSPAGSTTSSSSGGGFDAGFSSPAGAGAAGAGMAIAAAAAHHHQHHHHHHPHPLHHQPHLEPAWTSPLTKLVLAYCKGLTSAGLLRVARGCPHIRHLDLEGAHFLRDHHAVALVKCFPDLTFLRLNHCSLLTDTTFTAVLHHCPMLDTLEMEATAVGWGTTTTCPTTSSSSPPSPSTSATAAEPAKQFHNLRHLKLAWNRAVGDELLARVAAACPALRSLDLSNSLPVTGAGLATLGRACPNLTRLLLNGCKNVHSLEGVLEHTGMIIESRCTMSENQGRLLESCAPAARRAGALALCDQLDRVGFRLLDHLELGHSGFTDAGLLAVARHSRNLLHLSLEGCKISDGGLKSVMDECKHLQCLNLKDCIGITGDALAWMVFCRASLRHLVLPCVSVSEGERARLTRHGCELIKP